MRAVLSVYDKTGLVDFARGLVEAGVELFSTGGTLKELEGAGVAVQSVSVLTGFPEIMDGRVKTLHPGVHGGILADRRVPAHMEQLAEQGLREIDLVVVNLYPFEATVARPGVSFDDAIENIDIGGPTMIRAAAKNHNAVTVVVSPAEYAGVLEEIRQGGTLPQTRLRLARAAYGHTAAYDAAISGWLLAQEHLDGFPPQYTLGGTRLAELRYGENPHQSAALYGNPAKLEGIAGAKQLQGIALSYNNIVDLDAAWSLVADLPSPAAAIIKHTNPCGVALDETLVAAYRRAYECDTTSAFGGIVALNAEVDEDTAREVTSIFVEGVVAPAYSAAALELFARKPKVRVLKVVAAAPGPVVKIVSGGFLLQDPDDLVVGRDGMHSVGGREPSSEEWTQLELAWRVVKHVKSNAIVLARDNAAVGVGAGQMSRVESVQIAAQRAGDRARGSVMASDAFFPMADGIEAAAAAGVTAVIQPGGSIRDAEVLAAADRLGLAMVYTGHRHFRH